MIANLLSVTLFFLFYFIISSVIYARVAANMMDEQPVNCTVREDCNRSICINGLCRQCPEGHEFDNYSCIKKMKGKKLGEACYSSAECQIEIQFSICFDRICKCEPFHHGPNCYRVVPKFFHVELGGYCRQGLDCRFRFQTDCVDNVCRCKKGYIEKMGACIFESDYWKPTYDLGQKPPNNFLDSNYGHSARETRRQPVVFMLMVYMMVFICLSLCCTYLRKKVKAYIRADPYSRSTDTENRYYVTRSNITTSGLHHHYSSSSRRLRSTFDPNRSPMIQLSSHSPVIASVPPVQNTYQPPPPMDNPPDYEEVMRSTSLQRQNSLPDYEQATQAR